MGIKRILLVFFLSFKFIISMDIYIPKNQKEKEYLQELREKQLVLGIKTNYFANDKIDNESLNDILEELLGNYLQLNIKLRKGNWDTIYREFQDEKIDILGLLSKTDSRGNFTIFTNKIFDEELVVVSKDKNLNAPEDLNG
ncbi:MAG: hypothetical protein ACRC8F_00780, partial [Cetobacterium sp.]